MHEQQTILIEQNAVIRESLQRMLVDGGFAVTGAFESVAALREAGSQPINVTVILSCPRGGDVDKQVKEIKALHQSAAVVVLGGRCDLQAAVGAIQSGANACLHDATDSDSFFRLLRVASNDVIVIALSGGSPREIEKAVVAAAPVLDLPRRLATVQVALAASPATEPVLAVVAPPHELPKPRFGVERQGTARQDIARQDPLPKIGRVNPPTFSPRETAILQFLRKGEPNKRIARQLSLTESTVKVYLKSILRKIGVNNRTQAAVWAMSSINDGELDVSLHEDLNGNRQGLDPVR